MLVEFNSPVPIESSASVVVMLNVETVTVDEVATDDSASASVVVDWVTPSDCVSV